MVAVSLVAGAGCSFGIVGSETASFEYDFEALDSYLSDAKDLSARVYETPSSLGETVSLKSKSGTSGKRVPPGKFPKGKVFGKWVGKIDMASAMDSAEPSNASPELQAMGKAMLAGMAEMFNMDLALNRDHTFKWDMIMMPIEGDWKQKGDRLFLTPTKVMGFTQDEMDKLAAKMAENNKSNGGVEWKMDSSSSGFETLELRIAENGKALIALNPEDGTGQDLVFRRK